MFSRLKFPLGVKIGGAVFFLAVATGLIGAYVQVVLALGLAGAGAVLLGWVLSRPMRLLSAAAARIRDRQFQVEIPTTLFASVEERRLASVLETMTRVVKESTEDMDSIVQLVTELKRAYQQLQKRDEILSFELELAARIQNGIMPATPFVHHGFRVVAFYEAVEKLGGDFFDIAVLPNENLAILMADVSGHGPPAALITALTKLSFLHATNSIYDSPRELLRHINRTITDIVRTQEFLTAYCLVLGTDRWASFTNAGHHLALVMRCGERRLEEWGREGMILGLFMDAGDSLHEDENRLELNDRLMLYTDGLVEATNEKEEEFGVDRLKSLLIETMDMPLERQKESLLEAWRDYTRLCPVADDVCFLILEVGDVAKPREKQQKAFREHDDIQKLVAEME